LGGIPHYLKQFDDAFSLDENIQRKILSRGSILYSEVEFLMRQEMRETAIYNAIIGAVALGNTKLGDIHQKTGIEKTKLSAYLRNLMDLNIIVREFPVFTGVKEYANIHRGLYQVADNFFRFWYAFVLPNLSELETGDSEGIWAYAVEPTLNAYTSRVFEDVCRQFLRAQNRRSALPFHFTAIGRWWDKVNEIDIVATGPDRQNFIIGECKYRSEATGVADLSRLKEKSSFVKQGSKAWYVLFSKSGFTEELLRQAKEDESLNLYTPEDIVNLYTSEDIANLYASDDIVK
jgi:AAA+ ATPase superfamily predicted ATPase